MDNHDNAGDIATLESLKFDEDPRTITEMIEQDEYEDVLLTEATQYEDDPDSWSVQWGSIGTGLSAPGLRLKVGDTIRMYGGAGLGGTRHGFAVNGELKEWKTPWERFADRVNWLADYDRKKREEFEQQQEQLDADYEALPTPLKVRIDRFRRENPTFRVDSEGYEMFCCTEAAKFAEAARNASDEQITEADRFWADDELRGKAHYSGSAAGSVWEDAPESRESRWLLWAWALNTKAYDYDYDRQKTVLDLDDGHSGNTFGGAMQLAWALLEGRLEKAEVSL